MAARRARFFIGGMLATAVVGLLQPTRARSVQNRFEDQGTLVISIAGKDVGTEKFQIRPRRHGIEAAGEVDIRVQQAGRAVEFRTVSDLVLNATLWPRTYTWEQIAPRPSGLKINFLASPVTARYRILNGKTDLRKFVLPKNVVVLDDNVFSHYEILVWRYLRAQGRRQSFAAFIPQEALPGRVSVREAPNQKITVAGGKLNARHLIVTTDLARLDLWTNSAGDLERVSIPTAQLMAVRR